MPDDDDYRVHTRVTTHGHTRLGTRLSAHYTVQCLQEVNSERGELCCARQNEMESNIQKAPESNVRRAEDLR